MGFSAAADSRGFCFEIPDFEIGCFEF